MKLTEVRELLRPRPVELNPTRRRLLRCHDITDLRGAARRRLPRAVFDYVEGGADDEVSAAANWVAFRRWRLLPLNLQDVSSPDLRSELMGRPIAMPLLLAPTGYARMMHPDGEIAAARAARRAGLPYVLSTVASTSIEELAAPGHSNLWSQLYVWRDRGFTWDLVARAWAAG